MSHTNSASIRAELSKVEALMANIPAARRNCSKFKKLAKQQALLKERLGKCGTRSLN